MKYCWSIFRMGEEGEEDAKESEEVWAQIRKMMIGKSLRRSGSAKAFKRLAKVYEGARSKSKAWWGELWEAGRKDCEHEGRLQPEERKVGVALSCLKVETTAR